MTKEKSKKEIVDEFLASTPKDIEYFVQHTLDIAYQVSSAIKNKEITQYDLLKLLVKRNQILVNGCLERITLISNQLPNSKLLLVNS